MKRLFVSLLAAASILTPGVAKAENDPSSHLQLWKTLQDVGVTVMYNHRIHCASNKKIGGIYYPHSAMLVVCQDKMTSHLKEEDWTENDFDTLRHEAHHVVQDCANGTIADGKVAPIFSEEDLVTFLEKSSKSKQQLKILYTKLKESGLSGIILQEEMEAYVVAADIPAESISSKLIEFCS